MEEEWPPCSKPSQTQTSSSDDDVDDSGEGLPIPEEPPCIPPVEFEPSEEEEPTDELESNEKAEPGDGTEPTQLSLDQDELAGTCPTNQGIWFLLAHLYVVEWSSCVLPPIFLTLLALSRT